MKARDKAKPSFQITIATGDKKQTSAKNLTSSPHKSGSNSSISSGKNVSKGLVDSHKKKKEVREPLLQGLRLNAPLAGCTQRTCFRGMRLFSGLLIADHVRTTRFTRPCALFRTPRWWNSHLRPHPIALKSMPRVSHRFISLLSLDTPKCVIERQVVLNSLTCFRS